MLRTLMLVVLLALVPLRSEAAEPIQIGLITILDGGGFLYRGAGRFQAVEGLHVASGDILETGEGGFLRVEMPDRTDLQLGPRASVLMSSTVTRGKTERSIYLLRGWAKLSSDKRDKGAPGLDVHSALIDVPANQAVAVLRVTPEEALVFSQLGDVRVLDAHVPASPGSSVKQGDIYRRKAGGWKGSIDPSAMQAFLAGIPRPFRDSLPPLVDRFNPKEEKAPPPAPDFTYADVEPWLNAELPLRRQFVQRWRAKAENPAFRASLIANLSSHPEWDPVLFPEKYRPKPDTEQLDQLMRKSSASYPPPAPVRPPPAPAPSGR